MIQLVSILASSALLFFVFYLIYKGKLKEQYAIVWIVLSGVILFFSIFTGMLDKLAELLGVEYTPSLLFLFACLFILLLLIQQSVVLSGLKDNVRELTQEIGLLNEKINSSRKK